MGTVYRSRAAHRPPAHRHLVAATSALALTLFVGLVMLGLSLIKPAQVQAITGFGDAGRYSANGLGTAPSASGDDVVIADSPQEPQPTADSEPSPVSVSKPLIFKDGSWTSSGGNRSRPQNSPAPGNAAPIPCPTPMWTPTTSPTPSPLPTTESPTVAPTTQAPIPDPEPTTVAPTDSDPAPAESVAVTE